MQLRAWQKRGEGEELAVKWWNLDSSRLGERRLEVQSQDRGMVEAIVATAEAAR